MTCQELFGESGKPAGTNNLPYHKTGWRRSCCWIGRSLTTSGYWLDSQGRVCWVTKLFIIIARYLKRFVTFKI